MPWADAQLLLEHWEETPAVHETNAILAEALTSWARKRRPMTAQEHRNSLEQRWRSGQAMSPKQMVEAMGGAGMTIGKDGIARHAGGRAFPSDPLERPPGWRPHPGMPKRPAQKNPTA